MQVDLNPRGNGACPLCVLNDACRIQRKLAASVAAFHDRDETPPMELVVYSCPEFKEKG
jgi:hypothetical protein